MKSLALLTLLPACALATPLDDLGKPPSPSDDAGARDALVLPDAVESSLPECTSQRVVYVIAGNGGLAWFTQVWPVPRVIEQFAPGYSFDAPEKTVSVGDATHPLHERLVDGVAASSNTGSHPLVSVYVEGQNQTHTHAPNQTTVNGVDVVSYATAAQASQKALVPTIAIDTYGNYSGPSSLSVASVDAAVTALEQGWNVPPSAIVPDPTTLASWYGTTTPLPFALTTFASTLLFAANAFRGNYASTIVLPGFDDDPHNAFGNPADVTLRADALARVLHDFYAELSSSFEPTCSHHHQPVSLADNVLLVVVGDTPKNPFDALGWGDNTPGASNWIYVRSNGWLKPGWFGDVDVSARTGFDPTTGALSTSATWLDDQNAASSALLYAISRGNAALVTTITTAPYGGLIAPAP